MTTSPGSPFYPAALATQYGVNGQTLEVFWRGLELGPRTDENKIEQSRLVGGLEGSFGSWDYSTAINCGATAIVLCDTAGHATPMGTLALVKYVMEEVVKPSGANIRVDWHGHCDRGFAIANSMGTET